MSKLISDYAVIGDTHSTALVARDGSVDWLCWPRHDSPALFLKLLDEARGGFCAIAFEGLERTSRRYLPETNVLETTFETRTGRAQLLDLMPVNPPAAEPDEGPDGEGESRLLRLLTCLDGLEKLGRAYLPETSIVVLPADWIEGAYEQAWDQVRAMPGGVPRSVNLITGPSRTADIAQKLELGAHGPKRLLILIVERLPD